jgi:phosphohistidine phosphatase SixA
MLLHRHASAGNRLDSPRLDRLRPLDQVGRADAQKLPETLASYAIDRILSSPHRRCVETVGPLAEVRGIEVELRDELSPDAPLDDTTALLHELPDTALVCTHREVIDRLFDGEVACEKGGTWMIERRDSRWAPTQYLPPPTTVEQARRWAAVVG